MTGRLRTEPVLLLRLEGAAAALAALGLFTVTGADWRLAVICFLLPDLAMLGYLFGSRIGAVSYNAAHTYLGPAALGMIGWAAAASPAVALAAIWTMHIGVDRMLGYGLKSPAGFRSTHLGSIGRPSRSDRNPIPS